MSERDFSVDLHLHTNCSDGVFTPSEAVDYALKMKLAAISITDHDSVDAIEEAARAAKNKGIEIIPGIELSSVAGDPPGEMHILGYYIDYKSESLNKALKEFKKLRRERAYQILQKLRDNGVALKDESFIESRADKAIGRLHFAKAMAEEGFVKSVQEAFQKYLSQNKPAYAPKAALTAQEAINLILKSGGVPIMAHPYYVHYNDKNMMISLVKGGLMGLEAWHSKHPEHAVKKFLSMADELGIIVTGGSDCHGPYKNEPPVMGRVKVPYCVVENLEKCRDNVCNFMQKTGTFGC
ncbi:MAG: PHP domain-containing protein [Endomicrobium sp.]|jgi:predicted metal-dependent phosphoesterase TrpH|nr:PHP domain-containing protein [Endomicrobium sp.]